MIDPARAHAPTEQPADEGQLEQLLALAADLAESAPYDPEGDALVCAICDAQARAGEAPRHDPSCLIARARRLLEVGRDAFQVLERLDRA